MKFRDAYCTLHLENRVTLPLAHYLQFLGGQAVSIRASCTRCPALEPKVEPQNLHPPPTTLHDACPEPPAVHLPSWDPQNEQWRAQPGSPATLPGAQAVLQALTSSRPLYTSSPRALVPSRSSGASGAAASSRPQCCWAAFRAACRLRMDRVCRTRKALALRRASPSAER